MSTDAITQHAVVNEDGAIDWAATQAAVEAAIAADKAAEAEAAELEGLVKMPADLVTLRKEKLELDEKIDELTARKNEIRDEFGKRLEADNLVGFILNGKVHARLKHNTRTSVDSKKLKDELPDVYKNYLKTVPYTSVTIN